MEPDPEYQAALAEFQTKSRSIELAVSERLFGFMPANSLDIANFNFTRDIQAALILGDLSFVAEEIDWIRGLIANRGLPVETLSGYHSAYYQAAADILDESGQVIIDWLEQFRLPA